MMLEVACQTDAPLPYKPQGGVTAVRLSWIAVVRRVNARLSKDPDFFGVFTCREFLISATGEGQLRAVAEIRVRNSDR